MTELLESNGDDIEVHHFVKVSNLSIYMYTLILMLLECMVITCVIYVP